MHCVQGSLWVDDDLEDGYVRVSFSNVLMIDVSPATYRALFATDAVVRLVQAVRDLRGTFLLPRAVIEPEAAEDLLLGLSLVDAEPSDSCIYPPCSLPAEVVHDDGFPLCQHHAELMRGWDDLALA